jgi:hypothetical protein
LTGSDRPCPRATHRVGGRCIPSQGADPGDQFPGEPVSLELVEDRFDRTAQRCPDGSRGLDQAEPASRADTLQPPPGAARNAAR